MTEISFGREISRKLFHLLILVFPLMFLELGRWRALYIIAPLTLIVLAADYYRRKYPKIQFYFTKIFLPKSMFVLILFSTLLLVFSALFGRILYLKKLLKLHQYLKEEI